jgi:hypothetical protein
MRRMLIMSVALVAALAIGAPAAMAHGKGPDSPGAFHRGPDQGLSSRHLTVVGVVAADATASGVQVNVSSADPDAAASLAGATTIAVKIDASTRIGGRARPATYADLKAGDRVKVTWKAAVTPAAQLPAARRIRDDGPPPPVRYTLRATVAGPASAAGLPVTLGEGGRHIAAAPGSSALLKLDPATRILGRGWAPEALTDLVAGDRIKVVIEAPRGANPLDYPARKVRDYGPPPPVRFAVRGTVAAAPTPTGLQVSVSIANARASAALGATGTVLVKLDPATRIHKRGVRAATYADLHAGDRVKVVWWAPRGTALAALPAAWKVTDRGPAHT